MNRSCQYCCISYLMLNLLYRLTLHNMQSIMGPGSECADFDSETLQGCILACSLTHVYTASRYACTRTVSV